MQLIDGEVLMLLEFTKYFLAYSALFRMERKRGSFHVLSYYVICIVLQFLLIYITEFNTGNYFIVLVGTIIPLLFFEGRFREKIIQYLIIVSSIAIVDICWGVVLSIIFRLGADQMPSTLNIILNNSVSLLIICGFSLYGHVKKGGKSFGPIALTRKQYAIIGSGIISCFLVQVGIQVLLLFEDMSSYEKKYLVLSCFNSKFMLLDLKCLSNCNV